MDMTNEQTLPVGQAQLERFMDILHRYKAGKSRTEQRILASENWWKLRNDPGDDTSGFRSRSGWLHNVIVSKHADAIEAYPEPNILPRESADAPQARMLSAIIPCVLEQNRFEQTYSDVMWQKLKTGTGVYKVMWDASRLGGLGDIAIERVNLLNLYWEPGITDIQRSRYVFHTELADKELLRQTWPELEHKLKGQGFTGAKFLYDDAVDTSDKATVIEVYYHKEGKLHYCKFVDDTVLYATENDPALADRGLYDHGRYPFVFDTLYPIEGSPCGYGFVDLCRNPQTEIDILKTAFLKNARVGAVPRYFSRSDGNINEAEFLDMERPIVHVAGNVDEASIRRIDHSSLDGNYIQMLQATINELRQTSGNTETSTGTAASGVTAASAIAALQEASGKGSRDATLASYRAYTQLIDLCIELIRQFYDMPRQFRITGALGQEQFVSFTNTGLQPQHQGNDFGRDMGYRLPVFDIKVSAQKKNAYTKVSQNELALQFFKLGFFNPQLAEQTMLCLELMDFDGKDAVIQKVARAADQRAKLEGYMNLALLLAQAAKPELAQTIRADMEKTLGGSPGVSFRGSGSDRGNPLQNTMGIATAAKGRLAMTGKSGALPGKENTLVTRARQRAQEAAQPGGGKEKQT